LAQHFTVITYDRRSRGDSGDTVPYVVEREIEVLAALIAEAGGTASVYGHSSGAGFALHAAAHALPLTKLVLHEPSYVPDGEEERRTSWGYAEKLETLPAENRRGDAVDLPIFGKDGYPVHHRGVAEGETRLYFLALPFQHTLTSALIGGVDLPWPEAPCDPGRSQSKHLLRDRLHPGPRASCRVQT
jgi:pimeloyl-ACP methyl ester carboxylesterase